MAGIQGACSGCLCLIASPTISVRLRRQPCSLIVNLAGCCCPQASPYTAGAQMLSFDADPCEYFESGKAKASTLSLSVLVAIEMFNAMNALSEVRLLLCNHQSSLWSS